VEYGAKIVREQCGLERGATASVFTARSGIDCENFECTLRREMMCDSYCIYREVWYMLRQI